ncbi:hypothetical protein ABT095_09130 [Kitasatospora sp. NPDC002227]|uniref:hypothetical protein n=1 Tax=Kitasatospora sp. NPDC002227 TaxID=3154773 RepID=UPI003326B9EB
MSRTALAKFAAVLAIAFAVAAPALSSEAAGSAAARVTASDVQPGDMIWQQPTTR